MNGKGIYAWILNRCENGDMAKVVARLQQAGMRYIMPKIADGIYSYHVQPNGNWNYLPRLMDLCHKAGIKVIGWQYIYGANPLGEAGRAVTELKKLPFDGFVINAEQQYRDLPNNKQAAKTYCQHLKNALPNLKIGLSTYRFPSLHQNFPYKEFLAYCNWNMPQVYWMHSNGTVPSQLETCIVQYSKITTVPMLPTGAAFGEHGWLANPSDQHIFVEQVKKHKLQSCNWWEYYEAFNLHPELGDAIIQTSWQVDTPPIQPEIPPVGDTVMYIIETLGILRIRTGPSALTQETGKYVRPGEVHHATKEENGWYFIGTGWISGLTKYTRITEVQQPPPEPDLPDEPLTLEQRIERLEQAVFGEDD